MTFFHRLVAFRLLRLTLLTLLGCAGAHFFAPLTYWSQLIIDRDQRMYGLRLLKLVWLLQLCETDQLLRRTLSKFSMATLGETPGEEVMAMDPASLSNEVSDYSHVPPPAPNDLNSSTTQNVSPPKSQERDFEQNIGGDFDMEAPILEEDVIKAGGLGARDELDSFLPSAVDATDYEESLKDAMEYEDVQPVQEGEIPRPGVGFVKSEQERMDGFREVPKE